jgi:predicted nuclease of predicted toxin-antitoxin system
LKILLDMNLTPRWVGFLRERGHQAVRCSEVGLASASDLEVLRFAAAHGYLLLTHDLDFGDLLAYSREAGPSVVILRGVDLRPEASGERLLQVLAAIAKELEAGAIVVMDVRRIRVRPLPLG